MTTLNDTESHDNRPASPRMRHAPIYQLSPEATAADIADYANLQMGRVCSMLTALIEVPDEGMSDYDRRECLYACLERVEEVENLRGFLKFDERL